MNSESVYDSRNYKLVTARSMVYDAINDIMLIQNITSYALSHRSN